jgi:hypothetical protein
MKKWIVFLLMFLLFVSDLLATNSKRKFQLEVFSGISFMNPADLNTYPQVWDGYFDFWHDQRHQYNVQAGYIQSYDYSREGEFETIKSAFPLGLRVRWNVFKNVSLSLGIKTISASASSTIDHVTRIILNDGTVRENRYSFSPLAISASGWVPLLGIHFEKKLNATNGLELVLSAGPFSGNCQLQYDYIFEQIEDDLITASTERSVREEGKETGFTVEAFFRFTRMFSSRLGFFIETGYVHQKVDSLDGPGVLVENGEQERWEGEWAMKEYYVADYWGQLDLIYPSNSWEYPEEQRRARDFFLDLSGFQVRIGLKYYF